MNLARTEAFRLFPTTTAVSHKLDVLNHCASFRVCELVESYHQILDLQPKTPAVAINDLHCDLTFNCLFKCLMRSASFFCMSTPHSSVIRIPASHHLSSYGCYSDESFKEPRTLLTVIRINLSCL